MVTFAGLQAFICGVGRCLQRRNSLQFWLSAPSEGSSCIQPKFGSLAERNPFGFLLVCEVWPSIVRINHTVRSVCSGKVNSQRRRLQSWNMFQIHEGVTLWLTRFDIHPTLFGFWNRQLYSNGHVVSSWAISWIPSACFQVANFV